MNQLLANIRRLIRSEDNVVDPGEDAVSTAAHPAAEEAEMLHPGKRRIKEKYTSHWDLDYLPRAEVDRILAEIRQDKQDDGPKPT
jgi:hypothetical protein